MASNRTFRTDSDLDTFRTTPPASIAPGRSTVTSRHVMRKARDDKGVSEGAESYVARAAESSGAPLPADLRGRFEASLGTDLSGVRIHTGDASQDAAHAVGASAYAVGNDIHFGAGHYNPCSSDGQVLIAHEVAHTVQQSGGAARRQHKLEVSSTGDAAELEADRAADAMVHGGRAEVTTAGGALAREEGHSPKAGVELVDLEKGPLKGTLTISTDADGNQEFEVAGSGTQSIGPFPIGTSPFSWKVDLEAKISGKVSARKGETPEVVVGTELSGSLVVQGGIPKVATAFGGGKISASCPAVKVTKGKLTIGGPISITAAPIVGVESEAMHAKYQVDLVTLALAEVTFGPLHVAPGADLVALGNKLKAVVDKINAVLIYAGAKDMPRLQTGGIPGLTAFLEEKKKQAALEQAAKTHKQTRLDHGIDDDAGQCVQPVVDPDQSIDPADLE